MAKPKGYKPLPKTAHPSPAAQPATKTRKHRLAGSLLALGSAAVVSVYGVGYLSTQSSLDQLTAQVTPPPGAASPSAGSSSITPNSGSSRGAAPPASGQTQTTYKDGTYTGVGNSRHGGMRVTIVIQGGKITSASVTDCGTRYPCSDVNPLVSAVLTSQKLPSMHVSGATDSSNAYKQAVSQALRLAVQA